MNATIPTPLEYTEEGRDFLQKRVALFGLYGACCSWFFVVVRIGQFESLTELSMVFHVLAATSLMSVWIACRGEPRSVTFIRTSETVGVLAACAFYSAMGLYIPIYAMPHLIVILALGLGLIARAIFVPGSAGRTVTLTALAGGPVLLATYFMYHQMDVEPWLAIEPRIGEMGASGVALSSTISAMAWWACVTVVCFGASQVIYGLRKEVSDARKLGQYTLEERIGEGGMGIVYRASHAMLRRPTAIKLLPAEKSGKRALARFEKEVQLTAMLTHPNTVTVYDYGRTPDGVFYYAMELLDGATLSEVVRADGPQPAARVAHILDQVSGALAEAHAVNLVHRDVKPGNIMLVEQGGKPDVAKVLDFGLVKELARADDNAPTEVDGVAGTPQYFSPEAIQRPDDVDGRSDIYALGAVGYFLLTGEHVFTADTIVDLCMAHVKTAPMPPSERLGVPVPPDLEGLLMQCLAKAPCDRPENARALQHSLRECRDLGCWAEEDSHDWWRRMRPTLASIGAKRSVLERGLTITVEQRDHNQSEQSHKKT